MAVSPLRRAGTGSTGAGKGRAGGEVPGALRRASPTPGRPRLLLISYHFPPGEAAGALRWQKLADRAEEAGWELDVVTLAPEELRSSDPGRLAELPAGTRVYGVRHPKLWMERMDEGLSRIKRLARRARRPQVASAPAGAGAPESVAPEEIRWRFDARSVKRAYNAALAMHRERGWATEAGRIARLLVEPGVHRAVVSCGPPHMPHLAAMRVARRFGLPFVMDLRDPWSIPRRLPAAYASPLWFRVTALLERRAVQGASLVVANTEPVRGAMRAAHPSARARFITILNGYDEEPVPAPSAPAGRFTVAYAGGIYLDRDPRKLFRAAAQVVAELGLGPDRFAIELIGNVSDYGGVPIARMAEEEGLEGYVTTGPLRPRAEALEFLARATLLVSLPQDSPWAIPSKIFEYMKFDAWLLALAEPDGPVEVLLRGSDADVVRPDDVDGIAAVLRTRYRQYAAGMRPAALARDPRLSRRHQAELLFAAIEEAVEPSGSAPRRARPPLAAAR